MRLNALSFCFMLLFLLRLVQHLEDFDSLLEVFDANKDGVLNGLLLLNLFVQLANLFLLSLVLNLELSSFSKMVLVAVDDLTDLTEGLSNSLSIAALCVGLNDRLKCLARPILEVGVVFSSNLFDAYILIFNWGRILRG